MVPQPRGDNRGLPNQTNRSVPKIQPFLISCEAQMKLEVCQLTKREAHKLEHRQCKPNCGHHDHIDINQAFRMVNSQKARWVKVGWSIVCEVFHWVAKMSGGMKVQQLVEGDQVRIPARYPSIRPSLDEYDRGMPWDPVQV